MEESKENDSNSPKISKPFTTAPKSGKRRKNKRLRKIEDSIAKRQHFSIEKELGLEGLLEGKMVKQTIRIPLKLREAFKLECKANGVALAK